MANLRAKIPDFRGFDSNINVFSAISLWLKLFRASLVSASLVNSSYGTCSKVPPCRGLRQVQGDRRRGGNESPLAIIRDLKDKAHPFFGSDTLLLKCWQFISCLYSYSSNRGMSTQSPLRLVALAFRGDHLLKAACLKHVLFINGKERGKL